MDEMKLKLSTGFMQTIIAKMISKLVYEKTGYRVNINLNEVGIISSNDGKVRLYLNADADMDHSEFVKIVKDIGMD